MASRNLSHRSHGHKETGKKVSRVRRPIQVPAKECSAASTLSIRFKCGCRLSLSSGQIFLILPKDPTAGNRKRYLGHISGKTLHIHRDGRDFLRARQVYGLNVHLLLSADRLGFNEIFCDTPNRGGHLPPISELLSRNQFQYAVAGFEVQVGFAIDEIKAAA